MSRRKKALILLNLALSVAGLLAGAVSIGIALADDMEAATDQ